MILIHYFGSHLRVISWYFNWCLNVSTWILGRCYHIKIRVTLRVNRLNSIPLATSNIHKVFPGLLLLNSSIQGIHILFVMRLIILVLELRWSFGYSVRLLHINFAQLFRTGRETSQCFLIYVFLRLTLFSFICFIFILSLISKSLVLLFANITQSSFLSIVVQIHRQQIYLLFYVLWSLRRRLFVNNCSQFPMPCLDIIKVI